jgi:uncharacterized surface protein with fasciclin (FAS1) repeats
MISFKNKHNRQSRQACRTAIAALLGLSALTACSDWDDHYDANTAITGSQQASLWQNIKNNGELSQFAELLKKAGYDQRLDASQTYTVWAPLNNTFGYDQLNAASNDRLVKQFLQNHIARNNYPATGNFDKKIYMLNEKMMHFTGNNGYTIQGIPVGQVNVGSSNGTLHTVGSQIPFLANIYESLNNEQFAIDSVSNYYHAYDVSTLDETQSVPGPIVDGEQTYLDSIRYEDNTLTRTFRAYINREDSNYTMIVPTNESWGKLRERIRKCYNYLPTFRYMRSTAAGTDTTIIVTLKDASQFSDSISSYMLMKNLTFNNNIYDNTKLNTLQEGQALACDSLVSTTNDRIFGDDCRNLFANAKRVSKSNGAFWVTDDLNMLEWNAWNPEITVEAEDFVYKTANVGESRSVRVTSSNQNPAVSGYISENTYFEAHPNTPNDHPDVFIHLPQVRSTEYNVYLVMAPGNIVSTQAEHKPNSMGIYMRTCDETGKLKNEETLRNPIDGTTAFITSEEARIDTLFLGTYTFPLAYYGTGENYPYIRVRSRFSSANSGKFDRTLRVDCVILRPKALDEYMQSHPGYKYHKHNY